MKSFLIALVLLSTTIFQAQDFAQHVNPFIGTGGHGHTFPGATVPYGMVQLSPDTRIDGSWDGCGGYHYSDNLIYGFSHTHLNGTGVSDYGDIMLMPTMGEPSLDNKRYSSTFSDANEKASAGFYSVKLDKHDIDVRLTSSTRVGFHEYTFNKSGQANIILDLNHRDKLLYGEIRIVNSTTIEILRRSEAWARDQYVYARIEFDKPLLINLKRGKNKPENLLTGEDVAISFSKQVKKGEKILVKVSLSPTSYEGAKLNSSEINHWDFEKVKKEAVTLWNKELSKIEVASNDKEKLAIFYTALYHTMMQPNIAQDLDGKYRGRDNQIHVAEGFDYYTVFSLWDTFRGAHPLYTLIDKKRTADYINTFIKQYEQGGRLPVWELASNENDTQAPIINLKEYLELINLFFTLKLDFIKNDLKHIYSNEFLKKKKIGKHFLILKRIITFLIKKNKNYLDKDIKDVIKDNNNLLEQINNILSDIMEWYIIAKIYQGINENKTSFIIHAGLAHTTNIINLLKTYYNYKVINDFGTTNMHNLNIENNGCLHLPMNIENQFGGCNSFGFFS